MNAKEFIKTHGWEEVKRIVSTYTEQTHATNDARMFINADTYTKHYPHFKDDIKTMVAIADLKEYVDAYELVQKCGGLFGAKCDLDSIEYNLRCYVFHGCEKINMQSYAINLKQAITLIEEI